MGRHMLGDVVRGHRRRLGLSQEDLATRTGISVRTIRKIEAHQTDIPRPATVRLLADAFELEGTERDRFCELALDEPARRVSRRIRPAAVSAVPSITERALVGRVAELAALDSWAAAAAAGEFRIVWIGGEAGAGKSTLARAMTARLTQRGWNTAWGSSPEVDGTPSAWAWADVVRQVLNRQTGSTRSTGKGSTGKGENTEITGEDAELADLTDRLRPLLGGETPAPGGSAGPGRSTIEPFRVARAVVDFLRRHTEPGQSPPLLVVLDDVHRAGEETLQILRYAATELADRAVLVAGTFRPTEVGAAVATAWAALVGPRTDRIDLPGLTEADVGQLLRARAGAGLTPDVVRLITARTGGNPLFVGETARLIATEGVAAATETVPTGVSDILRRRLAALPAPAQAVLRIAAVMGLDLDTEILLSPELSPDPPGAATVLDGLEAAIAAGLLTELASTSMRFSHVLVRDTLYQDLSRVRRAQLHARVLAALERYRPGDAAALGHHALAAATGATARSAAVRGAEAARAATAVSAHQEAAGLLARALDVLEPTDPADTDILRLDLLCALVSAQGHAGKVRDAMLSRDQAVALAHRLGDQHRLARALTSYDAPALWAVRAYQEFDQAMVEGLEAMLAATPAADPDTRCRLLTTLATEVEAHDPVRAGRATAEAVALAVRLDDPALLCRAYNARYRYVSTLGPQQWPELDTIGQQQLAVATAAGLDAYQAQAHHILGIAELARNDLDRAQRHLDQAVEHATSGQLGLALGILGMFSGLRELVAGRFDQAISTFTPVLAQLKGIGDPNIEALELLIRFCIEHARGGPEGRARKAELARRAGPAYERYGDAIVEPYTWLLIAVGQREQARAVWKPQLALPHDHYWFRWTTLRAENALQLEDLVTAGSCYQQLLPWAGHLPGLLHAHITLGPVDHTLGDLAAVLHGPTRAAQHYRDAITVAEQIGAPHWAQRSRRALSRLSGPAQLTG